jgi:hypothetical protein
MKTEGARLVRIKPYRVGPSGIRGRVVHLSQATGLHPGDSVFQYVLPDGSVLLKKTVDKTRKKV